MNPTAVFFDLDKTLAESKSPMTSAMGELLAGLARKVPVAITSGAKYAQFEKQLIPFIPESVYSQVYLLPTNGAALYAHKNGSWHTLYEKKISQEEATHIERILEEGISATGTLTGGEPAYGPRIEFRGSQITFSALGQEAPLDEKMAWDPDKTKRMKLREYLMPLLPAYEIAVGGATSVDVVQKGIDKAYGVRKLAELLGLEVTQMLYIGDDLQEGGNDAVVIPTGIQTRVVKNPTETAQIIKSILES